jgi:2-dehydropantoate 2-reductase
MGAGGVGAYYGGVLADRGHDVTFVARGAHLAALRERGLELRVGDRTCRLERIKALRAPTAAAEIDLVLFAVKAYDSADAIAAIRSVVTPATTILTLQNGVDGPEVLAAAFGAQQVVIGPTFIVSEVVEPGVIATVPGPKLLLGEFSGEATPRLQTIADAFGDAGVNVKVTSDGFRAAWEKFVPLAAHSTITSACQLPIGPIRESPEGQALYRMLIGEAAAVGRACGVALPANAEAIALGTLMSGPPSATSSLQRDFAARRRVELDHLAGAVVRRARERNVPTPGFDALYAVLKLQALAFGGLGAGQVGTLAAR